MAELLPRVIVAGLAAAMSPVAVMVLISVMMRKHARRNSLLFLLGFTLVLVAVGAVGIFAFSAGGSGVHHKVDGYIDIALGALCLVGVLITLKPRKEKAKPASKGDLKPLEALLLGVVSMLANMSTIICYASGAHEISAAKLAIYDVVLALLLLTVITLLTLLIPITVYFVFPSKSEKVLGSLNTWLTRHAKLIGSAVFLLFGAYLLTRGIRILV
jgi:hypothetical protein